MNQIDERYKCLADVADKYLSALFQNLLQPGLSLTGTYLDYFRANRQTIKSAQVEYDKNLEKWRDHFAISNRLDRHKVAAITAHYLIRHFPIVIIENRPELNNVGILKIVNELATFFVAISRLRNEGVAYDPVKSLIGSFIQTFRKHSRLLREFSSDTISVEFMAREFYQLEEEHKLKVTKPS